MQLRRRRFVREGGGNKERDYVAMQNLHAKKKKKITQETELRVQIINAYES